MWDEGVGAGGVGVGDIGGVDGGGDDGGNGVNISFFQNCVVGLTFTIQAVPIPWLE